MGKYPKSRLLDKYSDWHWENRELFRTNYLTDVDKIWVEIRSGDLVAVFDIKEPEAEITWVETKVYDWFEKKGLPVYVVHTTEEFKEFKIRRWQNGEKRNFSQREYVDFLNNIKNSIF